MKPPRTPRDYALIDRWIERGLSNDQIIALMKREWRSELRSLPGGARCALCDQSINLNVCLECGQPTDGTDYVR